MDKPAVSEATIAITNSGDIAFHPAGHTEPILVLGKDGTIVVHTTTAKVTDVEVVDAMREFLGLAKVQRDGKTEKEAAR